MWHDFVAAIRALPPEARNFEAAEFGDIVRDLATPVADAGAKFREYGDEVARVAGLDTDLADEAAENARMFGLLGDAVASTTDNALDPATGRRKLGAWPPSPGMVL